MAASLSYYYNLSFHISNSSSTPVELMEFFDAKLNPAPSAVWSFGSADDFHVFYSAEDSRPIDVILADIEDVIDHYGPEHGLVTFLVYPEIEVSDPMHYYIMPEEGNSFTEVTDWEYDQVTFAALGVTRQE